MSNTTKYIFVPVEKPYDDYERQLLQRIEQIKREYEAVAKPFIDALIRSRACKPTHDYMQVQLLAGEVPK